MDNNIIIYSWSTLWSMKNNSGAPSFKKTIDLYLSKGWNVYLVLTDDSNGARGIVSDENLFVLKGSRFDKFISPSNISKPFLLYKIWRYNLFAKKVTEKVMNKKLNENVIFYGYEVHGVKPAKLASLKYKKPLVTRFQGTIVTFIKLNIINRIKHHYRINALKTTADLIIMTDDGSKGKETLLQLGNKSSNIKFWMNGLDLMAEKDRRKYRSDKFKKSIGLKDNEYMFLTVSRLQDWKRVDRAINIIAKLQTINSKLVVIGDGPEKNRLEELTIKKGVQDRVLFLGALEHDKVYEYIANTDIFFSLYDNSNVGNPLLEAMALGKCVITLDVGDTNKIVKNNINGLIYKIEDIDNIPADIDRLLKNIELKRKLEENAYDFADNNLYSWDYRMEMEYDEVSKLI